MYVLTLLTTLHVVAWFIYAFTSDGLFKPLSLLIAGLLIVNIVQYAVMLTTLKNSYGGRMALFVATIVG